MANTWPMSELENYALCFILVYVKHMGHFYEVRKYKNDDTMLQTRCGKTWILVQLSLELTTQPQAFLQHLPSPPLSFLDEDVPGGPRDGFFLPRFEFSLFSSTLGHHLISSSRLVLISLISSSWMLSSYQHINVLTCPVFEKTSR